MSPSAPTMINDAVLVKSYVYDLHDAVGLLRAAGGFDRNDPRPLAWVIDHLREYHFMDVSDLSHLCLGDMVSGKLRDVDERCGRLSLGFTKSLYRLFKPMAFDAASASFTDMRVHCGILTVQVYD